eukprot:CAMPEP_0182937114 /NCGR_PEP_ID=MMETSP0105_2-20130417/41452_1 /TAXON_ID=81532 ORGANISM="Acanthoeca-like sp., Strain 10tr" /NCGR_SAMPLE_ID=MMETSP0105_2 /ASSEMBLY_ACC=CAM_ASM_000205 /LENGTH=40 /DNA_ID= /DNA_START= /DNA_END= /DNA_ORIENTATION=
MTHRVHLSPVANLPVGTWTGEPLALATRAPPNEAQHATHP